MGDAVIGGVFLVIGLLLGNFLQWRSTEQQVRYTGLHERRARVLERLYALLYETDLAFKRWVVPFSGYDKAQQMEEVAQRYNALVDYYYPHALWLEKETQERLKTLIETMKSVFEDFSVLPQSGNPSHLRAWNEPPEEDMPKLRHEVNVRVLKEIPEQRAHLQDEFQMLLYPRRSWWRGKFGG